MKNKNWKLDEDGTQVNSVSSVTIPWLDISLETWFEIEENQNWFTVKQDTAFEGFLNLNSNSKQEFIKELNAVYSNELENDRIEEYQFGTILESINWKQSHICVPQLYDSENQYVLLLPETKWKIIDSKFTLELEFLYTNGKIEVAQEMSGLWNRIEWFKDYLKRKTTYNNT
jgi:hypothetical protein